MSDFSVKSFRGEYQVLFRDDLAKALVDEISEGDLILIDRHVKQLYDEFFQRDDLQFLELDASESLKSYQGLEPLIHRIIESGFRRGNRLVAIGGGVVQDATAFISSVLYRGVEWIFFPTTLLAQADSCIGSKTSINFGSYKNQLGGFYPPTRIIVHVPFLHTLLDADYMSGIGEMYHYFLIAGQTDFEWFNAAVAQAQSRDVEVQKMMVRRSLEIKRNMVERDEFDRGERQIFNYGHSFGHAIETLSNYTIAHGIAVAMGMDMANYVSEKLGLLPPGIRDEIRPFLQHVWTGYSLEGISASMMVEALGKDKKNAGNQLGLILTRGYGKMFKQQTDRSVVNDLMEAYFEELRV